MDNDDVTNEAAANTTGICTVLVIHLINRALCFFNTHLICSPQVVSRGKTLELLKPDPNAGKVHTILRKASLSNTIPKPRKSMYHFCCLLILVNYSTKSDEV